MVELLAVGKEGCIFRVLVSEDLQNSLQLVVLLTYLIQIITEGWGHGEATLPSERVKILHWFFQKELDEFNYDDACAPQVDVLVVLPVQENHFRRAVVASDNMRRESSLVLFPPISILIEFFLNFIF